MLEQYASPAKQKVETILSLTPEEKLHFKEGLESDPEFLAANRKLEESLSSINSKCNGGAGQFRLTLETKPKKSELNKSVDASVINLSSSFDAFDKLVAEGNSSSTNGKNHSFEDQFMTENSNDKTINSSFQSIDVSSSSTKESSLFGFSKINEKSSSESTVTTKISETGKRTKNKFVFRTPMSRKDTKKNEKFPETEGHKQSMSASTAKKDENDKYDVDTVLRELSHQNHLPIGANRIRPNSPPKNTHEMPNKKLSRPTVKQKEITKNDNSTSISDNKPSNSVQPGTSSSSLSDKSSLTSNAFSLSTSFDNTIDATFKELSPKTGFENLPSVLSRVSTSSALKTMSNVSSSNFITFFIY